MVKDWIAHYVTSFGSIIGLEKGIDDCTPVGTVCVGDVSVVVAFAVDVGSDGSKGKNKSG